MLTSVEIRDRSSSQLDLMELGDGGGTLTEEISTPLIACPSSASLTPLIQEEESGDVTNPMRVLIYTTSYNVIDGVTVTIRKLEKEILAAGGHVCILTTNSGDPANSNLVTPHNNRKLLFLDNAVPISFAAGYSLGVGLSKSIRQKIFEFDPTMIHITAPDLTCLHVMTLARRWRIPLMGTYHSNIPDYMLFVPGMRWLKPLLEFLFRHMYNFLLVLYVPTPFIKNTLIEQQQMDRVTNVDVWGRGVDLERFKPTNRNEDFRKKLGVAPDTPIVLYVGRLVVEKRPDIFASVIKRLAKGKDPFHAVIVGDGPANESIQNLPNTTHLGWLTGDELTEAYASSDIFLFPSSVETFGNVTLEAAASGLPVIVEAKCSGHLVREGVNGYACEAGNVDEFYEGTLELVQNAEKRKKFSKESIALSQTLDQHEVVRSMLDNYQKIEKEFVEVYGGSHFNRDEAWNDEDTFRLGKDPRPIGWCLVEWFFLALLRCINCCYCFSSWCMDRTRREPLRERLSSEEESKDIESNSNDDGKDYESDEENGNACANCVIAVGDSNATASCIMCNVSIAAAFLRIISNAKRSCSRIYCLESIINRVNASRYPKRKV